MAIHLGPPVARRLMRPTRGLGSAPLPGKPGWSPSYLALLRVELAAFHSGLDRSRAPASSLWRWSSPRGGRELPATSHWGARTFLTPTGCPTDARPSGRLADASDSTGSVRKPGSLMTPAHDHSQPRRKTRDRELVECSIDLNARSGVRAFANRPSRRRRAIERRDPGLVRGDAPGLAQWGGARPRQRAFGSDGVQFNRRIVAIRPSRGGEPVLDARSGLMRFRPLPRVGGPPRQGRPPSPGRWPRCTSRRRGCSARGARGSPSSRRAGCGAAGAPRPRAGEASGP